MKNNSKSFFVAIIGFLAGLLLAPFVFIFLFALTFMIVGATGIVVSPSSNLSSTSQGVGVIEIRGIISDSKDQLAAIKRFEQASNVKAVLVRIDSPGGVAGAAEEIYRALSELSKKKPVVASLGSVATSGGYFIALGADKIYASETTITGSVGVVMNVPDLSGIMDALKFKYSTIKSGKFKDTGSPFKSLSTDEKEYLDSLVKRVFDSFLNAVITRRKLTEDKIKMIKDGRVFTGKQAKEIGLVDEIGTEIDAIKFLGAKTGLGPNPVLIRYIKEPRNIIEALFGTNLKSKILIGLSNIIDAYKPYFL